MTAHGTVNGVPILRSLNEVTPRPRVLTIGTFDGVHRGHQALLARAVDRAAELGVSSMVVTFEPIPAMVLRPDLFPGRICLPSEKLERLAQCGVNEILVLGFTRDFSEQTPEEFMTSLISATSAEEIWVGEAFALGKNRSGNVETLRELGQRLGYTLHAMPRISDGDEIISSSAVRKALAAGDVAKAYQFLGRPFRVSGPVVHGSHYGRQIGYPTANMVPPSELVPIADGIYATRAYLPGESTPRPAMTYVGTRPTINTGDRHIETHVLDFTGDLYGYEIRVDFFERLRPDQKFATVDELIEQLKEDERQARRVLATIPERR